MIRCAFDQQRTIGLLISIVKMYCRLDLMQLSHLLLHNTNEYSIIPLLVKCTSNPEVNYTHYIMVTHFDTVNFTYELNF